MEIKSGMAVYQKLFSDKTALYSELFEELTQGGTYQGKYLEMGKVKMRKF